MENNNSKNDPTTVTASTGYETETKQCIDDILNNIELINLTQKSLETERQAQPPAQTPAAEAETEIQTDTQTLKVQEPDIKDSFHSLTDTEADIDSGADNHNHIDTDTDTHTDNNNHNLLGQLSIPQVLEELETLRHQNALLHSQIHSERRHRLSLQSEKNSLTAEIEELTKTLFEEANGMVALEAQARWTLEQAQERLQEELTKTRELLELESAQTRLLRAILEEEKVTQRTSDPVLWDIDVFGARLSGSYYDDFFQDRAFDSRERTAANHWELLGTRTVESSAFQLFSSFVDECFQITSNSSLSSSHHSKTHKPKAASIDSAQSINTLSDDAILTVLGHQFMRVCLNSDIEPCLTFPVLEKSGRTRSLLKKLLPAFLKNTCVIEPLTSGSTWVAPDSIRASPLSIRSFISVAPPVRSKDSSPLKRFSNPIDINTPTGRLNFSDPVEQNESSSPSNYSHDFNFAQFGTSPISVSSIDSAPAISSARDSTERCSMCDITTGVKEKHFHFSSSSFSSPPTTPAPSLTNIPTHRFRIIPYPGDSPTKQQQWNLVCKACRDRLVSVASFFTILRHLLQGHHLLRPKLDIFFDVMQAKRFMFYSRSGVAMSFYALSDFEAFSKKIQSSSSSSS